MQHRCKLYELNGNQENISTRHIYVTLPLLSLCMFGDPFSCLQQVLARFAPGIHRC